MFFSKARNTLLSTLLMKAILLSSSVSYSVVNSISYTDSFDSEESIEFITENGAPKLPLVTKSYLLPANADLSTLSIETTARTSVTIPGVQIETAALFTTGEDGQFQSVPTSKEFPSVYPATPLYNYSSGLLNQYKIVTISVSPYQFNRSENALISHDTIDITINYQSSGTSRSLSPVRQFDRHRAEAIVENNEVLESYGRAVRNESGHLLILTNSELLPQLTSLERFVQSKEAMGYTVSICTEESWNGGISGGDPHQIRDWIKSNFDSEGYTHLLIIDNPVDGAIPMLTVSPDFSGRYEPLIDMYYGELSGSWDINGDGKNAEYGFFDGEDFETGGVDRHMEIAVGRIPYYGNSAEINDILDRTVEYSSESSADALWRKHLYMPMSDFGPGFGDGAQYGGVIENNVIDLSDWELTSLYGSSCSIDAVTSLWNEAKPGLVVWQAHGLQDYAENLMFSADARNLTVPTHTYQTSCHTGKPEYEDNLAYTILRSGAITTIGLAVQCLYTSNKTSFGEKGGARDYGYIYAKYAILEEQSAAEALSSARSFLAIKSSSDWLNCVESNLYGDPTVGPYTTDITIGETAISTERDRAQLSFSTTPEGIAQISSPEVVRGGSVSLFSLSGRECQKIELIPGQREYSVTGNALAPGIYLAKWNITTASGTVSSGTSQLIQR